MANANPPDTVGRLEPPPRKLRKRNFPYVFNGLTNTSEEKKSDFLCPICFEIISEAHMTKCGHTFCYDCIAKSLEHNNKCPRCSFVIDTKEQIYPNFLLNELITKEKKQAEHRIMDAMKLKCTPELHEIFSQECDNLSITDVNYMLEVLSRKKEKLESDSREVQIRLLKDFLSKVKAHKQEEIVKLNEELELINYDSKCVQDMLEKHILRVKRDDTLFDGQNNIINVDKRESGTSRTRNEPSTSKNCTFSHNRGQDGFNGSKYGKKVEPYINVLANQQKRMHMHFDDLEQIYFSTRKKDCPFGLPENSRSRLNEFSDCLTKLTAYTGLRPLATLNYSNDVYNGSNIVSSIEFDKDNEFFAIAGVTKRIKMYDYNTVICDSIDIHYPVSEMLCNSKISCICWSSYHKGLLASSDYEGTVTLWDAFTTQRVKLLQEHEKRCWSVDFNKIDTKLIASGSDDMKVKLWSTALDHSVTCLDANANVCCVKFSTESRYHLAFGSADHCVHYYDLRNIKQPLEVFKGHRKAVSYVKFLNAENIVSASTDSQLKLWNVHQSHCQRSFKGHLNEKNFVGLATDGDFVACGSENNSLYVYYKGLSHEILTYAFKTPKSVLERDKKEEDLNEFVSAVCWRTGSNVVVAANSQGQIKVLELV